MLVDARSRYKKVMDETQSISRPQLIMGILVSTAIMIGSSLGLLGLLTFVQFLKPITIEQLTTYTVWLLAGSIGSLILAAIICGIIIKYPKSVFLPLKLHTFFKRGIGEYFLSPDPDDQNWNLVIRRSLYGSVLITGIALTIISLDLLGSGDDLLTFGAIVMVVSIIILPILLMLFYYGPWLLKDSGLFHLDQKDRSLSNVGDDLEDILEFFAGVDIVLVWVELTLSQYSWTSIFVILVALGPLFAIVLNFTIVFMAVKSRVVVSVITMLLREYNYPDIFGSKDYIRYSILNLIEREIVSDPLAEVAPLGMSPPPVPEYDDDEEDDGPEMSVAELTPSSGDTAPVPEYDDDDHDSGPEVSSENEM
ncbi:MAG: hypothetical protein RTU92_04530 [Candidatus Thorarchaeota archaeon]